MKVVIDGVEYTPKNSGDWNSGDWNSGHYNSGNHNSGHRNSGDCNIGHYNSGHWNSGHWNSGHYNSGNRNSGKRNSGNRNSGDCNSGDWNSGHWNSGDYNSGDCNSGIFNSNEALMRSFNKETNMTLREFYNSDLYINFDIELTRYENDTLITVPYKEAWANWWAVNKSDDMIARIKRLPNFDAKIFKEITGIKI